ncbi:MAG: hypothetical protein ACI86C_000979 [Candidatus Latescibacterota bacterium]|jgi:hypothetical protein
MQIYGCKQFKTQIMKTTRTQFRNNAKALLLAGMLSTVLFTSCTYNDDADPIIIDSLEISGEELIQSIQDNRDDAMQTFAMDASTGGVILAEQGTNLVFGPNAFKDADGDLVTGSVEITLMEIYKKADMVLSKLPTNAMNGNGDVQTILSAGEFYVNASQNGDPVFSNGTFQIFAPSDTFDPEMTIFTPIDGCDDTDCDIVWGENPVGQVVQGEGMGPNGAYVIGYTGFRDTFGWTNLDRWYDYQGPKTLITASVPEGYNATNSNVYVAYVGLEGLALLDIYDENAQLFTEHYGQMPIGQDVHFIFVSVQNGQYIYAIQSTTIELDHLEAITDLQPTTEAELFALIDLLP